MGLRAPDHYLDAAGCFVLAGITLEQVMQAVELAVGMNQGGDLGAPVPDYQDENVSAKVVRSFRATRASSTGWFGERTEP